MVCELEESEEEDTVLVGVGYPEEAGTQQGELLQEWKLSRVLNLGKKCSEHLKWTHLEQVQHCTPYPSRSHFQRTLNRERWGQGWNERCRSSGDEGEREDEQERGRRRKKTVDRFWRGCMLPFCDRSENRTAKTMVLYKGSAQGN